MKGGKAGRSKRNSKLSSRGVLIPLATNRYLIRVAGKEIAFLRLKVGVDPPDV